MLNSIISFSVKQKLIIGLFTIALIGYGSYQFTKLPIDAVPDITNNQVQVITVAPSYGATDIERLVTFPIELANSNISGLHEIRSFSRFGLSIVTIVFDDGIDIYWARQQVAERLQQVQADLPKGIGSVSMGPVTTGLGEIYQYSVRAKAGYESKYDAMELRTIQDWMVRRQLLGVKGVADVSSFGGKLKQYEIAINSNKLQSYNITVNDVFAALESNNQNTGGAYIEKGPTVLYIRSEGLVGSIDDIKSVFIKKTSSGAPLLIKDVADVRFGYATRYGAMCYNDKGEVAGGVVMMLKGANSSDVIKKVKERIAQIQKTLPEGVIIDPFLDRTKMVDNAIGTVKINLIEGALIVLFVLILFLGNIRAGFLVASVIPLAMLFAIIMMNIFGVSGNLMSLGALDFGLIIDGAVIIVEALLHTLSHKHKDVLLTAHQLDDETKKSTSKMMNVAVFGQIIILVVYLPIFFLEGIEGKMFKPMIQTVAFALIGAFILSLTYVPMMSSLFLNNKIKHKKTFSDKMMEFIERHYQKALSNVLQFPKTIIISAVSLFAISIFVLMQMGGEFIPALEEGDFAVETRVLTGSNLNTTIENTQKAAKILKQQFPEVEQIVTKIGSGEIPTDPMSMEAADMMIILKDKDEWTSAKTFPELSEKMSKAMEAVPGVTTSFQFPVQMRFNELMTGAKQDVVCKIFGENMDTLAHYAEKLGQLSATVEGTKNLYVEPVSGMPQIIIEYNRAAIAQYGLNISDINKIVNIGLAGQSTGFVFEGEKRFELVVRLAGDQRKNIEDVRNLLIPTSMGVQIPLSQLANVEMKEGPNQIQREDAKRRIVVGFNVRGRDVQSIVEELQSKVQKNIQLPAGYYVSYGGAFENLIAAKARLSLTVPISLFLIFLLLYFSFNSIKQSLLIYTAIPLSAIGGIFSLYIREMPFSISAGVGFIALFGVAVLNGIVLIAEFNRLKVEGFTDTRKRVLMGTKIRLRPVLMTAFVASLGFLPMAISSGAGAEVQRPLATVVIGGLMIATLLTLFVLPILYVLLENFEAKRMNKLTRSNVIPTLLVIGFFVFTSNANAQNTITLQASIDSALNNNLNVKNEKLKADYQKKLIQTGANIPQTMVNAEYGQINSIYTDTRFGIVQNLNFPSVYSNQKSALKSLWKSSNINVALKEVELKKQVRQAFYSYLYLLQKQKLLQSNDSMYIGFLTKATARFKSGESNVLEYTTAENQRAQISIQLNQLNTDMELLLMQFQLLLNTSISYIPNAENFKIDNSNIADSNVIENHPSIKLLQQQKQYFLVNTRLEKARLLPELTLAYSNMSIRGIGADNIDYAYEKRFQAAQIGLGIPLFFRSFNAKIGASKLEQLMAENRLKTETNLMNAEWNKTNAQYSNYLKTITIYESNTLNNAQLIIETANKQFANGEINYIEWVMLTNQAIAIKNEYLNGVYNLNESIIQLNYLSNK